MKSIGEGVDSDRHSDQQYEEHSGTEMTGAPTLKYTVYTVAVRILLPIPSSQFPILCGHSPGKYLPSKVLAALPCLCSCSCIRSTAMARSIARYRPNAAEQSRGASFTPRSFISSSVAVVPRQPVNPACNHHRSTMFVCLSHAPGHLALTATTVLTLGFSSRVSSVPGGGPELILVHMGPRTIKTMTGRGDRAAYSRLAPSTPSSMHIQ
jgi:hypothetical protein